MLRHGSWRRRLARGALATALLFTAGAALHGATPTEAHAAVSIQMTLEELVGHSMQVVVAEPVERTSRWEDVGGGRRIVTYTRLVIAETVAGPAADEVWVRTLGGKVDKIGQHVAGEATFDLGQRAVVFLERSGSATVVTGMAQGHYRLIDAEGEVKLAASRDAGTLLPRRGPSIPAREVLAGAPLARAQASIRTAWKQRGAGK